MDVILVIEVKGAINVKRLFPDAILIFLIPPDLDSLLHRLSSRGSESPEVVKVRMERAAEEAKYIDDYEYVIVNDDLDKCVDRLQTTVEAAKRAVKRNRELLAELRNGFTART